VYAPLLFHDRVAGALRQREDDLRDPLHVRHGDLHADDCVLQRADLHQLRALVPHDVEVGGLGQETLEELDGDERPVVDDHRRHRHLDQIVAHDAETAVGSERGDVVVDRHAIPARVGRDAATERGHDVFRGEEGLATLMRDRDRPVAALRAQRRLSGGLRDDDRSGGEDRERGEEDESLH